MQAAIAINGLDEEDFRRSIETMLRQGEAEGAARRLRALLAPYAGDDQILPKRFMSIAARDLAITGWKHLEEHLARHDRPGHPVTAISLCHTHLPENLQSKARRKPHFETGYYSDGSFPFSQSTRDELLEGYSAFGCVWSGDCEASDSALSLAGADDLYEALAELEDKLFAERKPNPAEIRAGSVGACYLAVLLYCALRDTVVREGLPRQLCVLAGSNGVYPYFDVPVTGIEQDVVRPAELLHELNAGPTREAERGTAQYASLLMSSIPRAKKRAVLVLEESADETAVRIAKLRGMPQVDEMPDVHAGNTDARELVATLSQHFGQEPEPATETPRNLAEEAFDRWPELVPVDPGPAPDAEPAEQAAESPLPAEPGPPPAAAPAPGFSFIDFREEPAQQKWGSECVRFELDNSVFSRMLANQPVPAQQPSAPEQPDLDVPDLEATVTSEPARFEWPPELAWQDEDEFLAPPPQPTPFNASPLAAPDQNQPAPVEPTGLWSRLRGMIVRKKS